MRLVPQACLAAILLGSIPLSARSQTAPGAPSQDPLLGLMLSQPRIDVDSPVVPIAGFEPAIIKPGPQAIYRLTFNALETSIKLPPKLSVSPPVEMRPTAHGQLLVVTGTNYQPRTSFNFRVRPEEVGVVTIPPFKTTVYGKSVTIPGAQLRVVAEPPPGTLPAQTLKLQMPQTNVYVGQAVHASVALPPATVLSCSSIPAPSRLTAMVSSSIRTRSVHAWTAGWWEAPTQVTRVSCMIWS